jgi:MOSC domain-containing protein YiiM
VGDTLRATLEAIYIAPTAGAPMAAIEAATVHPGRGIEGDRYFAGVGSFSRWPGEGRAISMIEQEVIDALREEHGFDLAEGRHRRNLVTRGVRLAALNGRTFRIGAALFRGARECAPCRYLERRVAPGLYDALRGGRGGLRVDVLEAGALGAGDAIELVTPSPRK